MSKTNKNWLTRAGRRARAITGTTTASDGGVPVVVSDPGTGTAVTPPVIVDPVIGDPGTGTGPPRPSPPAPTSSSSFTHYGQFNAPCCNEGGGAAGGAHQQFGDNFPGYYAGTYPYQ